MTTKKDLRIHDAKIADRNIKGQLAALTEWSSYVKRSLSADLDTAGGYMLVGEALDFLRDLTLQASAMRQLAFVMPSESYEMSYPTIVTAPSAAEWLPEIGQASDDASIVIGAEASDLHRLAKLIKISNKLLRQKLGAETVLKMLAASRALAEETAFIQGDGVGRPLGILLDPNLVSVTTEVSGTVVVDDLIGWIATLPDRYVANGKILTSLEFMGKLWKLKSGEGDYLIPVNTKELWEIPLFFSDGMPDSVSGGSWVAGSYGAIYGSFTDGYTIVDDKAGASIYRLSQLYAGTAETGFNMEFYCDGHLADPSALVALKIHA